MIANSKFAVRMLVKAPGFTAIAVITLALGIGANTAIFSVLDAVLLHPLSFPKPNELVAVWSYVARDNSEKETESIPDYVDLRDQSQTLQALAAFTRTGAVLNRSQESQQLYGVAITSDIFPVLAIPPARGRPYTREDDNVDARVVVLTDYAWKTFFNSDPDIVGKQISLSWRLYTVLGVMPPGFRFPVEGERADYLIPLHPLVPEHVNNRDSHFIRMVGRLKPGVTIQQCDAEMKTIAARLEQQYPKSNTGRSERVFSLHNDLVGDVRPALITIFAAVVFVLLIACANVANLLLARATARQREIANLFFLPRPADLGLGSVDHRRLGRDGHAFHLRLDAERESDLGFLVQEDFDLASLLLEAGDFCHQVVLSARQAADPVFSSGIRDG